MVLTAAPQNGSLDKALNVSFSDPVVTYTPDPHFNGTDAFRFRVGNTDGLRSANEAEVLITVRQVNDAPYISDVKDSAGTLCGFGVAEAPPACLGGSLETDANAFLDLTVVAFDLDKVPGLNADPGAEHLTIWATNLPAARLRFATATTWVIRR